MGTTRYEVGEMMISGKDFIKLVKNYFSFLVDELNYQELNVTRREGLFYDVEYKKEDKIISISYENREDYLQVILFKLKNGMRPDYDDKESTIHLEKLNNKVLNLLGNKDFIENDSFFSSIKTTNAIQYKLLKSAKELRLCLKNLDVLDDGAK